LTLRLFSVSGRRGRLRLARTRAVCDPGLYRDAGKGRRRPAACPWQAADKHIHEVDARIDVMSADPLPDILPSRPIWAYDDYARAWKYFPAVRVPGNTLRQGCP